MRQRQTEKSTILLNAFNAPDPFFLCVWNGRDVNVRLQSFINNAVLWEAPVFFYNAPSFRLSALPPLVSSQSCFQVEMLLPWWFQSSILLQHDEEDLPAERELLVIFTFPNIHSARVWPRLRPSVNPLKIYSFIDQILTPGLAGN